MSLLSLTNAVIKQTVIRFQCNMRLQQSAVIKQW